MNDAEKRIEQLYRMREGFKQIWEAAKILGILSLVHMVHLESQIHCHRQREKSLLQKRLQKNVTYQLQNHCQQPRKRANPPLRNPTVQRRERARNKRHKSKRNPLMTKMKAKPVKPRGYLFCGQDLNFLSQLSDEEVTVRSEKPSNSDDESSGGESD